MDAQLRIVDGAKPAAIRLKLPLKVGRSRSAKIKVPQSQVSRTHCEIYEESGMLVVNDLGSSNGTYISGERIDEPTFLLPGETLQIGKVLFEADYEAPDLQIEETEIEFVMDDDEDDNVVADEHQDQSANSELPVIAESDPATGSVSPAEVNLTLDYNETDDGSFLGIPDIAVGAEPVSQESASQVLIEDENESRSVEVDPSESALNNFFKNLE